ncbi:hypothetical protein B1748_09095 [Paenibacillus sp. MY03]|uniref:hypothetical protein n=1 Tax=Paenibacillus sp. MY03 TaxID=302980 RepID=UPI000B3C94A0|nr:hypothetical protein [Paenibacillus sp. MY03]OUS77287.1 hypothetical protein B1748_09095 [Paenibacillus sp. MY03]
MVIKMVEFALIKEGTKFNQKQKDDLKKHIIFDHHWRGFTGLEELHFVSINDNSFTVKVAEVERNWHQQFSNKLCQLCHLQEHYLPGQSGNNRLLHVINEQVI